MYDRAFYDTIRPGVQASAAVVVPLALRKLRRKVSTVIDVGCGEGWWALAFEQHGAEVIGVDGSYVAGSPLGDRFIAHDLTLPLPTHLAGRFDLAVCLEVAEHLPESQAERFVADLCSLADAVLFSAAIPHQSGAGHIHLRWPSYWADLFDAHGFGLNDAIRWQVWDDERVEPWYRQNLHLAVKGGKRQTADVVHPVIHGWGR